VRNACERLSGLSVTGTAATIGSGPSVEEEQGDDARHGRGRSEQTAFEAESASGEDARSVETDELPAPVESLTADHDSEDRSLKKVPGEVETDGKPEVAGRRESHTEEQSGGEEVESSQDAAFDECSSVKPGEEEGGSQSSRARALPG